jgi:hypothetical protein
MRKDNEGTESPYWIRWRKRYSPFARFDTLSNGTAQ